MGRKTHKGRRSPRSKSNVLPQTIPGVSRSQVAQRAKQNPPRLGSGRTSEARFSEASAGGAAAPGYAIW
eukprot:9031592-Alexandrium_andersonii.AAC.1